jgi:peroxiredoxin
MRFDRFGAGLVVLLAMTTPARAIDDKDTPLGRLAQIEAAQKDVQKQYSDAMQKVERTEKSQAAALETFYSSLQKNMDSALQLARVHPGDPAALEALKFVIRTNRAGPGDASARALKMILEGNLARASDQRGYLPTVALTLRQYPDAEKLLRLMIDENPSRTNRAQACYWLANHLHQQARMVRELREKPEEIPNYHDYKAAQPIEQFLSTHDEAALERESEALFERVVAEFGDEKIDDDTRPLGVIATGELFTRRSLKAGKVAPEIEGTDEEGKSFKLSDYRGKVVVLTFSGNWCGPCRGMYPQERILVSALEHKPFAMVSVNTDKDVQTLRDAIKAGEITWPCWNDGGTDGPITTHWGIISFPTIFVLDPDGVIRHRDLRGEELDRAVAALLAKIHSEKIGAN